MVEIEIGVLNQQCLDRRIADRETLFREVANWQRRRNAQGARVRWMFDVNRAREKLCRAYPAGYCSGSSLVTTTFSAPSATIWRAMASTCTSPPMGWPPVIATASL